MGSEMVMYQAFIDTNGKYTAQVCSIGASLTLYQSRYLGRTSKRVPKEMSLQS